MRRSPSLCAFWGSICISLWSPFAAIMYLLYFPRRFASFCVFSRLFAVVYGPKKYISLERTGLCLVRSNPSEETNNLTAAITV